MYQNKRERNRPLYIALIIGTFVVIYVAIATAPYASGGLPQLITHSDEISFRPSDLVWTPHTLKTVLTFLMIYAFAVVLILSNKKRYHRSGSEHGSSDYADIRKLQKEFHSKSPERIVYTQNYAISVTEEDTYKHKRNYNSLIIGGPGSNKTRGYVYPNLLEAVGSYVVLDAKGEISRSSAKYMKDKRNYKIKVLDLINPNHSWCYNPFVYIHQDTELEERAEDDIQKIVTAIYKATTAPNSQTLDPFWDEAGKMLLSALMYLLYYFGAENEKNFPYLMELIRAGRIENSEDDERKSPLDILFYSIEKKFPDHISVRYYKNATSGAGKTMQSVQITLLARLQKFELKSIQKMMSSDELELEKLATEPTVLYCKIPDNDTSYNFIISLLYIQLFQVLYDQADNVYDGRLPLLVHIIMDEFATVHTPEDFLYILAGCRSRGIAVSIIIQAISQLKVKFKEAWENILGQCDTIMYLGNNEPGTHKYISETLGPETIDTFSTGRRYGSHGDSSANFNSAGRELLNTAEVRTIPYEYAVVLIKNELPLIDLKIDISHWKKAKGTAMCGNKSMKYDVPLRSERLKETESPQNTKRTETNIFDDSSVGKKKAVPLKFFVNGQSADLSDFEVSELITDYYVDFEELNNYLQNA